MNLRYIALYIDSDSGYEDHFRNNFNLNCRFISNYLSIQVRKLKIHTDGTFNMISVAPSINIQHLCRIVGEKSLQARISFDKEKYQLMNEIERYDYYLKLLENGYKIQSQHKEISIEHLLKLHQTFKNNDYKNEWIHKKKTFKSHGIKVILKCIFTSVDFQLQMYVYNMKSGDKLLSGTVIRTLPDEICFESLFRDVTIENDELIITEYQDRPKFKFLLSDILNGNFSFKIINVGLEYHPYNG